MNPRTKESSVRVGRENDEEVEYEIRRRIDLGGQ